MVKGLDIYLFNQKPKSKNYKNSEVGIIYRNENTKNILTLIIQNEQKFADRN